ncbi:hypothetical protein NHH03_01885 [Stieleria sp. TO1_6]|uniref:hypothetical protein n=1 Tax=Stieleria tagensis TaxID=2956795 RepID=UPI00209ADB02|nr:hypothetical protein [Stieleria tagensis]MCO8120471.1 hypothetical protein [Stieleria tagensis]
MASFESELLHCVSDNGDSIFAWCVLPNHYHLLLRTQSVIHSLTRIGRLHGKLSFEWNRQEELTGRRKVWAGAAETAMKSERHYFATLNYVLNNPVHHGYVKKWTQWPLSNANEYLQEQGRQKVLRQWHAYPIRDYGKNWDPPDL